jgi:hypothetical protein
MDEPQRKSHGEDHEIHKTVMLSQEEPQKHEDTQRRPATNHFGCRPSFVFVVLELHVHPKLEEASLQNG